MCSIGFFFFNYTATTEIYTLSLPHAPPVWGGRPYLAQQEQREEKGFSALAEQLAKWMAQQKGD